MDYRHRSLITGEKLEAFRKGLINVIPAPPVSVHRLSVRHINRRYVLIALICQHELAKAHNFELALEKVPETTPAAWENYGTQIGKLVAAARPFYSHTTLTQDLIKDEVDAWEATWRAHLGGRLHPKAKEALLAEMNAAVGGIAEEAVRAALGTITVSVAPAPTPAKKTRKKKEA
jgi:hypothetical protein